MVSYLALYRKYRPNNFNDLVGQPEIVSIIKNEILNDKISHAYLFSGPRGTGKTSTAKIIARMINCSNLDESGLPCGKCESCINFNSSSDIVEIDAASNNGVDEIRELRDKVNLVPTYGKYKIYIIDEVHMLTTQAFNALLKTLEEPPSHIVFILATTEFYKIPITVVSRCQKFQFLKFSNDDIVGRLKEIAVNEAIAVGDDVLYEIARLSDGGLRDAINMLDQLSSFKDGSLCVDDVYKLNGVISYLEFRDLLSYIYDNDIMSIVNFLENIDKSGKNFARFIDDFICFLKDVLVFKNTDVLDSNVVEKNDSIRDVSKIFSGDDLYKFIILLCNLSNDLKNSSFVKILLISEFIKFSNVLNADYEQSKIIKNNLVDNSIDSNNSKIYDVKNNFKITKKEDNFVTDKLRKIRINNSFVGASKQNKEEFMNKWSLVLDKASSNSNYVSIAGMLNDIEVLVVGEKNVMFLAQYDSLLERLNSQIVLIENLLFDVYKCRYKIIFLLNDEWDFEKKNYISNLKSSKKYVYIEEGENDELNTGDSDIEKIVSILGNDVIEYV